jgi:dye decolorizing peroxidase
MTGRDRAGMTRRGLLGTVAGTGAAAAVASAAAALPIPGAVAASVAAAETGGTQVVPFHGAHQAGVTAVDQAHETLLALDLRDGVDREALSRMMRLLSDDAARLSAGRAALADLEPELADAPSRLAFAFGFGPRFVVRASGSSPSWLAPLPTFGVDRLDPAISDGDLLILIGGDDPLTIAHAARMLLKDAARFTTLRWRQRGFRRARGTVPDGTTMRNLFGQVDGTVGPHPGDDAFGDAVWIDSGWLAGGTSMVIRRVSMNLDDWDLLGRSDREHAMGRRLDTGAPVTGGDEHDDLDLAAVDPLGFTVVKPWAHARRARVDDPRRRISRRGFNYDDGPMTAADSGTGLVFISVQADPVRQFVPIQTRLDELDLMNRWTTPVGSAVFAIPPGCERGGYIGETLLG